MKVRNGFVSNSSSSSFIVFMPKEKMSISKIEEYFDGYSNEIDQKHKDLLTMTIWRNQYLYSGFDDTGDCEETETIYTCDNFDCYNRPIFDEYDPYPNCENCDKCSKVERKHRNDDYYSLKDSYSDNEKLSKKIDDSCDKSIYRIEIDDNEPTEFMTFEEVHGLRECVTHLNDSDKLIVEY